MDRLLTPSGLDVFHLGPSLEKGPLPSFFYFALSGEESLTLAPLCAPVESFQGTEVRCFSFTLPYHGSDFATNEAMTLWGDALRNGTNFFEKFLEQAKENIDFLIHAGYVDANKMAIGGLSRGGFIACQLAARVSQFTTIVAFAPLTTLVLMEEFRLHGSTPLAESLALIHQVPALVGRHLRFYIGNRDHRVGTKQCFHFIEELTEASYQQGHRSPAVELIISPSIGHKGHGTSSEIFKAGAEWVKSHLL